MSFKGKVKALLEGGEGTRDHPGGQGKSRVVAAKRGEDLQSLIHSLIAKEVGTGRRSGAEQHNGHAARPKKSQTKPKKEKSSDESQTENSNHPFYQKVKALSRGKKNNSLLERKSPKLLFILDSLKPCEKKSKMDGEKKKSKTDGVKSKMDGEKKKSKTDGVKSKMDEEEEKSQDPVEAAKQKYLAAIEKYEQKMKDEDFKQSRTRELLKVYKHPESGEDVERESEAPRHEPKRRTVNFFEKRRRRLKAARRAKKDRA